MRVTALGLDLWVCEGGLERTKFPFLGAKPFFMVERNEKLKLVFVENLELAGRRPAAIVLPRHSNQKKLGIFGKLRFVKSKIGQDGDRAHVYLLLARQATGPCTWMDTAH